MSAIGGVAVARFHSGHPDRAGIHRPIAAATTEYPMPVRRSSRNSPRCPCLTSMVFYDLGSPLIGQSV